MNKVRSINLWKLIIKNNIILFLLHVLALIINWLYNIINPLNVSGFGFDSGASFLVILFFSIMYYSYYLSKKKSHFTKYWEHLVYYLASFVVLFVVVFMLASLFGPTVFVEYGLPLILLSIILSIFSYWRSKSKKND